MSLFSSTFATVMRRSRFFYIFCLLISLWTAPIYAWNNYVSPKYEVRAVWLTTIGGLDWPRHYANNVQEAMAQKRELCRLLNLYQKANINTVLVQTRIRSTVIYPSRIEPWDGCMTGHPGKAAPYDPLAFVIDECHKRGMECQAWVVCIPVGKWNSYGVQQLRKRHGSMVQRIGAEAYLNPENTQTANYIADICEEITHRYDIDGIHLDYIRYPETWKLRISHESARRNITNIVRAVHNRVKNLKPWVKMSCAPIGKSQDLARYSSNGWNAYTRGCQDAQGWLREGIMDELFPMMYFRDNQFYPFAIDWSEQSYGKIIAPGLGIYFLSPHEKNWRLEDITREMEILRQYGMGYAFFRSKFLTDNMKGFYQFTKQFNPYPALVPPMTWMHAPTPQQPTDLRIENGVLQWNGDAPYYNIYASRKDYVDTEQAENLLVIHHQNRSIKLPKGYEGFSFAVTACDRYGNESKAAQLNDGNGKSMHKNYGARRLETDGRKLFIPNDIQIGDGIYLIETLQGVAVASRQHTNVVDVSSLPDGCYQLKTINKKGIKHRVGFFTIRRKETMR